MNPVETLYSDFESTHHLLMASGEISAATFLQNEFRKVFLISCASFCESEVCLTLNEATRRASGDCQWLVKLVRVRVTVRNYHSLFEWNANNANSFFGMFGDDILSLAKQRTKEDLKFSQSISAFLEIGRDRNRLVHGNYATFSIEKTPEEMMALFKLACAFVGQLRELLGVDHKP